jgi:glycosyltransferase involved in cell wall biosynthesis
MMSHLLVLSAHDGHVDRRIIAQINTLVESGRSVTLFSIPAEIPDACLDSRATVLMPAAPHPVASRWSVGKSILRAMGPQIYNKARSLWHGPGRGPEAAWTQFFLDHAPAGPFDAIICHDLNTLPAGVQLKPRWPTAKLIYDSHELFPCQTDDKRIEAYWTEIEARNISHADLIITVNHSIAREMSQRYGVTPPEVIYNSDGISSNSVAPDRAEFLRHFGANDGFKVLYQGNIDFRRNLDSLVLAFEELGNEARLFLLGGGAYEAELKKICTEHRLTNVHFGRPVSQKQLAGYTSHADLGIIPYVAAGSLNTLYCTPNKLFEYIEATVPICASDLPELRNIIRGSGIGEVYKMNSPGTIAGAILDCKARLARGEFPPEKRAAARVAFSWSGQAQKLLAMFNKLGV